MNFRIDFSHLHMGFPFLQMTRGTCICCAILAGRLPYRHSFRKLVCLANYLRERVHALCLKTLFGNDYWPCTKRTISKHGRPQMNVRPLSLHSCASSSTSSASVAFIVHSQFSCPCTASSSLANSKHLFCFPLLSSSQLAEENCGVPGLRLSFPRRVRVSSKP